MIKKLQKAFSVATLLVASCFVANGVHATAQENVNEKLMLFTDLHYLSPSLMNNGGTTLQKEIENDNKMFDKASEVLDAIITKALADKPAGVLIPGDLTKNGEKYSHNEVAAKLQTLVDAGIKVWVIPGNHDVNNTNARSFAGGMSRTIASPTSSEFATIYANMGYNDALECDPNSLSYVCEPLPGLRLIAIDDNLCKERDKNKSLDASGISAASLNWILAKADEAKAANKQVMVMTHHQVIPHIDDQNALMGDAMIAGIDNLRPQFLAHGMRMFLTGHIHISNASVWYTENKNDSIVEVTTGSAIAYPCPIRYITMNKNHNALSFTTHNITKTASDNYFDTYALNRAKSSTRATVSSIIWHSWDEISTMLSDYGATLDFDGFVDACYNGLGDVISDLTITMSKGNEQKSGVTFNDISSRIDSGSDKTVDVLLADQNGLVRLMAKGVVRRRFHDLLDTAMKSALADKTSMGTPLENCTDDLTLTAWLPAVKTAGIPGDVNGDGTVDIADVNAAINLILTTSFDAKANVNGDNTVDIADINALINIILAVK